MTVVIDSERDQRALNWLIEHVRHHEVAKAWSKLAAERRAYPSNCAKVCGLAPTQGLQVTARANTAAHLGEIGRLLEGRLCT